MGPNPFDKLIDNFVQDGETYRFYDLNKLNDPRYGEWTGRAQRPLSF